MKSFAPIGLAIAATLVPGAAIAEVTVCNEIPAAIHVAFAYQNNGAFTAEGWWTVASNACQDVPFTLQGDTLYYTAHSDSYRDGRDTKHQHWGNKLQLYVGNRNFTFSEADKSRRGAKPEMFSSASRSQQQEGMDLLITVFFKPGGTTVSMSPKK